jgi:hypothetical protein
LESNGPHRRAGKAARFAAPEQREKVKSTDLSFESSASRAGGGRRHYKGKVGGILAHKLFCSFLFCRRSKGSCEVDGIVLLGKEPRMTYDQPRSFHHCYVRL